MRNALFALAVMVVMGLFVGGCASDEKMSDTKPTMSSVGNRASDKVMVTTGRGQVTYGWDKTNMKPMALAGEASTCPSCTAAVTGYYVHGKMPPATCPDCGAKIAVSKAG